MKAGFNAMWGFVIKITAVLLSISLLTGMLSPYINPYYFWPAAFFGLAYPVIWFLSLGCTLLMIRRKHWFYASLLLLMIGAPLMLNHFSLPFRSNKSKPGDYSFVTYNVHGFSGVRDGLSNHDRKMKVHDFINEIKPSVVCMQEYAMKSKNHAKYLDNQDVDLNLPYKAVSEYETDTRGTLYCLLIASSHPIKNQGVVFTLDKNAFGMYADIQFPEGMVRVYNIHLESVKFIGEKKLLRPHKNLGIFKDLLTIVKGTYRKLRHAFPARAYQAKMIAESIRKCPYPVILAGDFNDTPASYSYRLLHKGLEDAASFRGFGFNRTYAESLYPIRIDQVFVDRRLKTTSYHRKKIYLSDHFPVVSGFSFK
jgi:endonuclease/exonuclease/phosphatase family metal-dependent hydrolase